VQNRPRTRALSLGISLSLSLSLAFALALARPALAAQAPAVSEDDQAEGKRLFEKGLLRYDTAEYDEAIRLFRAAYERTRAPALLFNMAQAYRLKDDCRKAADLYHQFIRMDPESPDRERAESRLAMMEPCAPPSIAAVPPTTTAVPAPAALIAVREAPRESPAHARGSQMRAAGAALGGVAVAVAAAGGVFWKKASNDEQEISDLFARGGDWDAHAADVDADGRRAQQTARALFVTAGIAVVVGVASYLYGWRVERSPASR
jgi:tetratricopeptide (TPR) repeat protein